MITERVFIAFGANIRGPAGDPVDSFQAAARILACRGVCFQAASRLYSSDPWGGIRQPKFLNGVWEVRTLLPPTDLMDCLLDVERLVGRRRGVRWGPRVIDLDLLIFGRKSGVWMMDSRQAVDLELPHPRMAHRAFVLMPLADMAPVLRPWGRRGPTVSEQVAALPMSERLSVRRFR
ncbi:MAG: 2-amino-4-hydroxy-6-hydroxymethyldihydropteridine diphosphokinase [Candidatus Phaeomarinobacter sp.]